jgi:stage III sporulation protein SpoIIIAA
MTQEPYTITDNLDELLSVLPQGLQETIAPAERPGLIEIVLDLGRKPEARYVDRYQYLREEPITREDLDYVEARLGAFGNDNRAGIPATLHRISAMRNRRGTIVGLTLRVGRAVTGILDILRDIIESGESLLLMGRPGLGKTTLLREMARVVADEIGKRVVIVDTSNEIAGDGDVPHPAIGRARRMQVARVEQQHDVMIEAVENHMPEVVVIDEIGRLEETMAARTIAERGVQLIATVHGNTLDNLLANPTMSDLIGGIQAVTLSDEEARRRGTQKTVLERKAPPTFNVVVEMIERDKIAVRRPVAEVVDAILRGQPVSPEIRFRDENGDIQIVQAEVPQQAPAQHDFEMRGEYSRPGKRGSVGREGGRMRRVADNRKDGRRSTPAGDERSSRSQAFNSARLFDPGFTGGAITNGRSTPVPETTVDDAEDDSGYLSEREFSSDEMPNDTKDYHLVEDEPVDVSRVRRVYPFGVSRSRLARAIKHLGIPVTVTRTWQDADAVMLLGGAHGLSADSTMLREARQLHLPIISVRGNTYAQIVSRLNDLFGGQVSNGYVSARELALQEAKNAVQRVLADAEPVDLRPQSKSVRSMQHQLAERYHLHSYSVGREPNRRVRFLPTAGGR